MHHGEEHNCCGNKKHVHEEAAHSCGCSLEKKEAKSCCCSGGHNKKVETCCGGGKKLLSEGKILWISFFALVASFLMGELAQPAGVLRLLDFAWIAIILCGLPIAQSAWKALRDERKVNSPMLITVAMIATICLEAVFVFTGSHEGGHGHSYLFAAGEIAFLMALGEFLEERTVAKSRAGIERLVSLAPKRAERKAPDGAFEEIDAKDIKVGDTLLVRPNTIIPTDGRIVSGATSVNQANMTGESVPIDKAVGDEVLGGTMNESGAIEVEALRPESQSALAKLIELVEEAEGKKAPIARIANRWASYIVPAAITLSIVVFFFARFVLDTTTTDSFVRAVTILVVFCPCAFVLATPTAIAAGLGNVSKRGILVKSGGALEELAKVDAVVFDKTGTLTTGEIAVSSFETDGMDGDEMLSLAASAEAFSEHPIAKAVTGFAQRKNLEAAKAENVKSLVGTGVECDVGAHKVKVARASVFKAEIASSEKLKKYYDGEKSKTVVGVEIDGKLSGLISLSDTIREEAKPAISALKEKGYFTAMLTGDNVGAAAGVAEKVGLDKVYHSLMPEGKLAKIAELEGEGKTVCMVGDGVNDAPALASANCSIAMAALGNDVAIETADVAMMTDDLRKIPSLLRFAKQIIFTIKSNMLLSLAISFAAIALSAYGYLDPVLGALVHNASSVLVVTNSARLLKTRWK